MQGHHALQDRERATAGAAWQERGLIFTAPAGAPIEPSSFSHAFSAMAQRAGLGRWHVHEPRHTAASLMLAMGTKLEIVSRVLGHSSVTVTADVYGAWGPLSHLPNFAFRAPQFVHTAATGTPVNLSGVAGRLKADDGLDLCYVYDLGRATTLLQTADTLTHTTYNVAAGKLTTNAEVIAAIKSIVPGFDVELEPGSSAPPATSTSPGSTTTPATNQSGTPSAPSPTSSRTSTPAMRSSGPPTEPPPESRLRKSEVKLSWLNTLPDRRHQRGAVAPDPDGLIWSAPVVAEHRVGRGAGLGGARRRGYPPGTGASLASARRPSSASSL